MIGTGHTAYCELGILMPGHVGEEIQFQPYVNYSGLEVGGPTTISWHHFGLGVNMFIHRTTRRSPSNTETARSSTGQNVESRKGNSFVLQMHLFI